MEKIFCDRCKEETKRRQSFPDCGTRDIKIIVRTYPNWEQTIDLCDKCKDAFIIWLSEEKQED